MTTQIVNLKLSTLQEELKPKGGTEWIWYGKDNLYPQMIAKWFDSSPTNQSIIKYKGDLTAGEGFISKDESIVKFITENKLNTVLSRISLDLNLYGGFALNIISDVTGKIAKIEYLNFASVRVELPDDEGIVNNYWVSRDWTQHRKSEYRPKSYKPYNNKSLKKDKNQIYYYIQHYPNLYYYPQPDYCSALQYVELEVELQKFHNKTVKNNFTPSLQITIPNVAEPEEREELLDNLSETFGGSGNALKPIVTFVEGIENKILIEPITTGANVDIYTTLELLCEKKIIIAQRLTSPELIGIVTGGASLGGDASKVSVSFEYFYNTVIKAKQNQIIDVFKELFMVNGFNFEDLAISNMKPLQYLPESILTQYFDESEIREIYGYEPRIKKEIITNTI